MNIFALDHSVFIMAVLCLCLSPLVCSQLLECAAFVAGLGENSAITELADVAAIARASASSSFPLWVGQRSAAASPRRFSVANGAMDHGVIDRRIEHALHAASQERYPHALAAHYAT
jgi:hypothetical protein